MQGTWALTIRSLRQDNRLMRYHMLRFIVAGLLAFMVFVIWESGLRGQSPGRELFSMMAYANLFAVTVVGGLLFAPTITEEKEEQTLGLLRMTRIGPSALLLGKSLPKLVLISLILIVQLPLVFLTRTLGGVDWPLILNAYLLIFCQLIGVVSISMLVSVVMRTNTGAVVLTGCLLFFWFMFTMIIEDIQRSSVPVSTLEALVVQCMAPLSPFVQMDTILQTGANVDGTFPTCAAVLFMSAVCYVLGVKTFSYWNTQESTQTELEILREKVERLWHRFYGRAKPRTATGPSVAIETTPPESSESVLPVTTTENLGKTGRTRRSHASWQHAIAWKDYFLLGGGRTGVCIRCLLAMTLMLYALLSLSFEFWHPLMLGTFAYTRIKPLVRQYGEFIVLISFYAFCLDLLYITVNLFARELKQQTWESMLLLPQSLGSICRQKIWGAAIQLIPWVASFIAGLTMMLTLDDIGLFIVDVFQEPLIASGVVLHVVIMLTTLLLLLTWLSLRLNPWVSILIAWFVCWGVGIAYVITFFIAFGFMSGPGPMEQQVLFHVAWITAGSVTAYMLLRSIRSTLQGEASAI